MYDMSRVMSKGYNDSVTPEQREQALEKMSLQRWEDAANGKPAYQPAYNNEDLDWTVYGFFYNAHTLFNIIYIMRTNVVMAQ